MDLGSVEKSLYILDAIIANNGKVTKAILNDKTLTVKGVAMLFDINYGKGLSLAQADKMYQEEVVMPKRAEAWGLLGIKILGGGGGYNLQKKTAVEDSVRFKLPEAKTTAGETKTYSDGSVRDSRGRFAGSSGAIPGTPGVDKVIQEMKTNPKYNGYEVIGTEISVKSSDGTLRRYDIVVRKPDGTITGIEVKSGSATRTAQQNRIDAELNKNSGLPTTGKKAKDAGITRIDSVELITVK